MIDELIKRYLILEKCSADIENAKELLINAYKTGNKVLLCGNGGSSADCDHVVGELMKGFKLKRPLSNEEKSILKKNNPEINEDLLLNLQGSLPAISLPAATALNTAYNNDVNPDFVFAQQVYGLGRENDVLVCFSTSGNSNNVVNAAQLARALKMKIISFTGESGGELKSISDICINVPETETFKVQELHLPIYHYLCMEVEEYFFGL